MAVCIVNKLSGISQNKNIMIKTLNSTMKKTEQNNTSLVDGPTALNAHALWTGFDVSPFYTSSPFYLPHIF
jgi:hypothetical protein